MAKNNTNDVSLRYGIQSALDTVPTAWEQLEPNNISSFGNTITTVVRRPISPQRGRKKGTTTDRDSTPEMDGDFTMDSFEDFIEGFMYSTFVNEDFDLRDGSGLFAPGVNGADQFVIDPATAALAGKILSTATTLSASGTLLYAKGYANSANNDFHVVDVAVSTSDEIINVASTLTTETPTAATSPSPSVQIAGMRFAIGELAFTLSGSTATLVATTTGLTDWADLGLQAGMFIHIGSATTAGVVQNALDDGAGGVVYGYARIASISTTTLNLEKLDIRLDATDAANAGIVDVMFGRFCRNVEVSDADFLTRYYEFEMTYPDLEGASTPAYEYAINNQANELTLNLPLTEKATMTWGFQGTLTNDITATRETTGTPGNAPAPLRDVAVNTSLDIASLTTDVISLATDVCFKSLTITINNNASPEKCLGKVGASFINTGQFEVTVEGQMLFTDKAIVNAVSNNTTVTMAAILKNEDGAVAIDWPSMTFGGGDREFPVDQSVLVNITGETFTDPTLGYDMGVTMFARVPTDRSTT